MFEQDPTDNPFFVQETYDNVSVGESFHGFDFAQGFHPQHQQNGFVAHGGPPTPPSQGSYNPPFGNGSNGSFSGVGHLPGDIISHTKVEGDDNSNGGRGSEEDNLTPAQSKRKAQNRAAYVSIIWTRIPHLHRCPKPPEGIISAYTHCRQRAFRERKEKHVKDLEAKLADLEAAQQQASLENERLKRDLQKMTTENEILKATSTSGHGHTGSHSPEPMTTGPMRYSPTDFASSVLAGHDNKSFSHRVAYAKDGQRLLAAGASWDLIISHELFKRGLVDIGSVSEHLKTRAICDGQGPVFSENDVFEAIEMSVASGSDDLL
jgi:AP-1-like transcription factor